MINKIFSINTTNGRNISFKNSSKNEDDKINVAYEQLKVTNALDAENSKYSALIGLGTGSIAKLAKQNSSTALLIGFNTFLASYAIMGFLKSLEYFQNNKDAYKEYEEEQVYANKFDEFISKHSVPVKVDFEDEEKNRRYYNLAKSMRKRELTASLAAIGVAALSAIVATIICFTKNVPEKLDKIGCTSLIAGVTSFFVSGLLTIPANKKEYDNQCVEKNK